jgi:taurine dioxygenase
MKQQSASHRPLHSWRNFQVRPISGAIGAEIHGVDIAQPLGDKIIAEIREAFLEYLVIFFRDQKLTPEQQVTFARRFGDPVEYPQLRGLPECPLITPVIKLEHERSNFGGIWHSDTTYLARPPMAGMLYALETPPWGGDTMFANQYLAYEALSDRFRQMLSRLTGVNT